jgi:hypothetical protein
MQGESAAVVCETHKRIGAMYKSREFVYLRHVFREGANYFIADKSIEY